MAKGESRMNREIKFRGKSKETGKWVYGSYHKDEVTGKSFIMRRIDDLCYQEPVDPETVGQSIGIADIKDDEMYEGDIVSIVGGDFKKRMCMIKFDCWGFVLMETWPFNETAYIGECDIDEMDIEIIGNACENPDLAEEFTPLNDRH